MESWVLLPAWRRVGLSVRLVYEGGEDQDRRLPGRPRVLRPRRGTGSGDPPRCGGYTSLLFRTCTRTY